MSETYYETKFGRGDEIADYSYSYRIYTVNGVASTAATVATGFNVTGPLKAIGLAPKLSNDQFGVGFLWGQPGAALQPVVHDNEYAFEAFYTLQLTPTLTLLPDVQMIFNPVNNAVHDRVTQFALQLNLTW